MLPEEELRRDAVAIVRAGVAAVEPETLVRKALEDHPELLPRGAQVHLVAVGKAARAMARGAASALIGGRGEQLAGGVLIAPKGSTEEGLGDAPAALRRFAGGHPVPDAEGMAGARAVLELAEGLGRRAAGLDPEATSASEVLLILLSGGGSALMTLPPEGVPLESVQATTEALLASGAPIREVNAVRKHLDRLKGGRLARAAAPAPVVALVLSDVVGDPLDVIASGPLSPDPTTTRDAVEVLRARGLWGRLPATVRNHLEGSFASEGTESPKPGDPCFGRAQVRVVGNDALAAEAACREAERRGYRSLVISTLVTGEARQVGRILAGIGLSAARRPRRPRRPRRKSAPAAPVCLVAAGETTVRVTGEGRGGRNQEVALGAALTLNELARPDDPPLLVASAGTDGIDGPTDAAGALADASTVRRARALGLDAARALADNDAYPFFDRLGDLVRSGPTGTNVMDLMLVLVGDSGRQSDEP